MGGAVSTSLKLLRGGQLGGARLVLQKGRGENLHFCLRKVVETAVGDPLVEPSDAGTSTRVEVSLVALTSFIVRLQSQQDLP